MKTYRCTQGGEGEEGGNSCTPLKDLQKLDHKNAIKMKIEEPQIFSQPQVPPSREFGNDCASSMNENNIL
jgi:hypothetical protein